MEQLKEALPAFFGNSARSVVLKFAIYSESLNYWVNVQLLFEYSISDQVIFSKSFHQFRTDIYETPSEKAYWVLDIIRLVSLLVVCAAYMIEVGMETMKDRFTLGRFFRIVAILFCLSMFVLELAYMGMQTPTLDVL